MANYMPTTTGVKMGGSEASGNMPLTKSIFHNPKWSPVYSLVHFGRMLDISSSRVGIASCREILVIV